MPIRAAPPASAGAFAFSATFARVDLSFELLCELRRADEPELRPLGLRLPPLRLLVERDFVERDLLAPERELPFDFARELLDFELLGRDLALLDFELPFDRELVLLLDRLVELPAREPLDCLARLPELELREDPDFVWAIMASLLGSPCLGPLIPSVPRPYYPTPPDQIRWKFVPGITGARAPRPPQLAFRGRVPG